MIIKAIFDLKQEVDHLKARLDAAGGQVPSLRPVVKPASEPEEAEWQGVGAPVTKGEIGKFVDISAETQTKPADLSLRKSNLEIIEKALEKHGGNRKLAAQEVGISERTLYRWIEKYHLDKKTLK